jgi:hypothetical protein
MNDTDHVLVSNRKKASFFNREIVWIRFPFGDRSSFGGGDIVEN